MIQKSNNSPGTVIMSSRQSSAFWGTVRPRAIPSGPRCRTKSPHKTRVHHISKRILDHLLLEAELLCDEVQCARRLAEELEATSSEEDDALVAFSCETMRASARLMCAVNWLQRHRDFLASNHPRFLLKLTTLRPTVFQGPDPYWLGLLTPDVRELVLAVEAFNARLIRLDHVWHERGVHNPEMMKRLQAVHGMLPDGDRINHS